jgi:hypothetical protein
MQQPIPAQLINAAINTLLASRQKGASLCPSEVARHIGGADWRVIMPAVHAHVKAQARRGHLRITQKGESVQPDAVTGVYRISPDYA